MFYIHLRTGRIFILTFCLLLSGIFGAHAQGRKDLKINEVLLHNVGNYEDDFGRHSTWIEIFNSSYGTVDIGGCYLTNDLSNPKMYYIQRGDILTKIPPRNHVLFWADNRPTDGTFHTNFTLETNFVALVNNDGQIIDSITLPALSVDQSYGRTEDGGSKWSFFEKTTPSTNNKITELEAGSYRFKENDPFGVIMTVTAMTVVFVALILLFLAFKTVGVIMLRKHHKREAKHIGEELATQKKKEAAPNEIYAAIAFAVQQYQHDVRQIEKAVLTINKVARAYSPWSSKIYGLREVPVKKDNKGK